MGQAFFRIFYAFISLWNYICAYCMCYVCTLVFIGLFLLIHSSNAFSNVQRLMFFKILCGKFCFSIIVLIVDKNVNADSQKLLIGVELHPSKLSGKQNIKYMNKFII